MARERLRHLLRVAMIVTAATLLAGFIATRGPVAEPRGSTAVPARIADAELAAHAPASDIPPLHDRRRTIALLPSPRRNPFAFRAPLGVPAAAKASAAEPAPSTAADAAAPFDDASLMLIGIAEDPGADGPVRIAIISSGDRLWLVKEGELVAPDYRVGLISTDSAELFDSRRDALRRLAFK